MSKPLDNNPDYAWGLDPITFNSLHDREFAQSAQSATTWPGESQPRGDTECAQETSCMGLERDDMSIRWGLPKAVTGKELVSFGDEVLHAVELAFCRGQNSGERSDTINDEGPRRPLPPCRRLSKGKPLTKRPLR